MRLLHTLSFVKQKDHWRYAVRPMEIPRKSPATAWLVAFPHALGGEINDSGQVYRYQRGGQSGLFIGGMPSDAQTGGRYNTVRFIGSIIPTYVRATVRARLS